MSDKIYDFLNGTASKWLEDKALKKLKEGSLFQFEYLTAKYDKVKLVNNRFIFEEKENEYYMFAYKHHYATIHWGDLPRFHIEECRTREQYSGYQFANSMPVDIFCTDQKKSLGPQRLKFCRNCNRALNFFSFGEPGKNWFDVIIEMADKRTSKNEYDDKSIRLDGYTKDWRQVSYAIRAKGNFQCENCSVVLENNDAYYLEVHHIDRNPRNNAQDNLKVLCTECHANVDESHYMNYNYGRNKLKLISFKNRFRN